MKPSLFEIYCLGVLGLAGVWAAFQVIGAMPFGPALSPSVEPLRVSLASPLQSLSQGEE